MRHRGEHLRRHLGVEDLEHADAVLEVHVVEKLGEVDGMDGGQHRAKLVPIDAFLFQQFRKARAVFRHSPILCRHRTTVNAGARKCGIRDAAVASGYIIFV